MGKKLDSKRCEELFYFEIEKNISKLDNDGVKLSVGSYSEPKTTLMSCEGTTINNKYDSLKLPQDIIEIAEMRNLDYEQAKNTNKYIVTTFDDDVYQYSGRSLSNIINSLATDEFIYIGNTIYRTNRIISIERVEE